MCPSGGTLYGSTCQVTYGASTCISTSCPSGGTLYGSSCYTGYGAHSCVSGPYCAQGYDIGGSCIAGYDGVYYYAYYYTYYYDCYYYYYVPPYYAPYYAPYYDYYYYYNIGPIYIDVGGIGVLMRNLILVNVTNSEGNVSQKYLMLLSKNEDLDDYKVVVPADDYDINSSEHHGILTQDPIPMTELEYNTIIETNDRSRRLKEFLDIQENEMDIYMTETPGLRGDNNEVGENPRNLGWELGLTTCSGSAEAYAPAYYYYYVYYDYSYYYYSCCPWGGSLDGSTCYYYYDAGINYYYCCPSGGSVSGSSCYYYYDASCSYYYCCPSGGSVSGSSCYYYYGATPVTYGQYECRSGGSLQSDGVTCLRNNC